MNVVKSRNKTLKTEIEKEKKKPNERVQKNWALTEVRYENLPIWNVWC